MDNSQYVLRLVTDIEDILNNILLSGAKFYNNDLVKENNNLITLCEKLGLDVACEKLKNINSCLLQKSHYTNFDFMHLSNEYFFLSAYLDIVKGAVAL